MSVFRLKTKNSKKRLKTTIVIFPQKNYNVHSTNPEYRKPEQHKNENQPPDVGARGRAGWSGVRVRAGVSVPVRACRGVGMGAVVSSRVYMSVFVWVRGCPGVRAYRCVGVCFFFG